MPETSPAITPRCVACGSDAVIADAVPSLGGAYTIRVRVDTRPGSKLSKRPVTAGGHARVCGDCGFIMLYADDPPALWDAYVDRVANDL